VPESPDRWLARNVLFDDLGREGLDIAGIAAGNKSLIDNHLLVDPVGAGIFHVGRHRVIGRHPAAFGDAGFDQHPRRVADRRKRFLAGIEIAHQRNRILVLAKQIGVDHPAGNDQRVILVDADRVDGAVDCDRLAPIVAIPAPDFAGLERDDVYSGAGFLEPQLGHRQFRLLKAVGGEDGNPLVADISHG
jgi:hypothetical protein